MTRWPRFLSPGWLAAYAVSGALWLAILHVVPWWVALPIAAALLLAIAAGWRWMWTGHAVPPGGRR